jgi:hypothetical protein
MHEGPRDHLLPSTPPGTKTPAHVIHELHLALVYSSGTKASIRRLAYRKPVDLAGCDAFEVANDLPVYEAVASAPRYDAPSIAAPRPCACTRELGELPELDLGDDLSPGWRKVG